MPVVDNVALPSVVTVASHDIEELALKVADAPNVATPTLTVAPVPVNVTDGANVALPCVDVVAVQANVASPTTKTCASATIGGPHFSCVGFPHVPPFASPCQIHWR